ncbi:MAG: DUF354 domain-containing protein, partial [Bacteroidales bacterium]|nr:DUF354 domain-containing protein [Bacteroidales bacterium]
MIKVLIDINHPAHVHLFKNFAWEMQKKGHKILFTTRDKECTIQLLEYYKFDFISFGKHYKKKLGKIFGLFKFNLLLILTSIKFKPDIFLSHGSIYAAHTAFLLRKLNIAFEDTGNKEQVRLYKPFTKFIFTSNVFEQNYGIKQIRYNAYHELAYLHPKYFKPDETIFSLLDLKKYQPYVIIRFVSWDASHDKGQAGIGLENKIELIKNLSSIIKVFISSEEELPENLKKYQIKISPEKIHDAIAFSSIFIGEGATMASECAVLGTPAIYIN